MAITKIGLSTNDFALSLGALPDCLSKFEALGADTVELTLSQFDVLVGGAARAEGVRELRRICADSPLGFTVHGPTASSFTDERSLDVQKDVCRAGLDISGEIGATAMVHHAGGYPRDVFDVRAPLAAMEREALAEMGGHAAGCGVVLCVENLFGDAGVWFAAPHELAAQIRAVDHDYVRATVDFSHAALNAGVRGDFDLMGSLTELAPLAAHLHIHDSFGRPPAFGVGGRGEAIQFGMGDLHLPPGWGALDWEAIAALPYATDLVANLELSTRFEEEVPAAIAFCRRVLGAAGG